MSATHVQMTILHKQQSPDDSPNGVVFLGQQEVDVPVSTSAVGTGWTEYVPELECGGPKGTPGRQCPHSSRRKKDTDESSLDTSLIHVSIASYRDPQCPDTLLSLFYNSVNPKSVRVKLLLQNDHNNDVDCVEEYCQLATKMKGKRRGNVGRIAHHGDCPHSDQIHVRRMNADVAAGPMHARSIVSEMVATSHADGEIDTQDFCLSVDSHTEFGHDWDKDMVEMFYEAENEYAILSTRPADLNQFGTTEEGYRQVPHLCSVTFTTSNVRMGESGVARNLSKPKLTNGVWSSAMSFSKCHAELKVPVDPHAPNVFDGDEFNRAVRFWTYGYDIYTPNRIAITHDYQRSRENSMALKWKRSDDASWNSILKESHVRLKTLAGMPGGEKDESKVLRLQKSKFGLGDRRSLEQFIAFSGIGIATSEFPLDGKSRCGNLQWVSFPEHVKGVDYIPQFDDKSEDPIDAPDKSSVWYDGDSTISQEDAEDAGTAAEDNGPHALQIDDYTEVDVIEHHARPVHIEERKVNGGKEREATPKDMIHNHGRAKHGAIDSAAVPSGAGSRTKDDRLSEKHFRPGATHLRYPGSKASHAGLHKLPPLVQVSVVVLVLGLALSIFIQKGTGVGRKKYLARKKRAL